MHTIFWNTVRRSRDSLFHQHQERTSPDIIPTAVLRKSPRNPFILRGLGLIWVLTVGYIDAVSRFLERIGHVLGYRRKRLSLAFSREKISRDMVR